MNESEVLEAINLHAANGISSFTIFLSFTFAYITAAYLAGEKLTTLQVSIISCIYFSGAFGWAASTLTHTHSFETLAERWQTEIILEKARKKQEKSDRKRRQKEYEENMRQERKAADAERERYLKQYGRYPPVQRSSLDDGKC